GDGFAYSGQYVLMPSSAPMLPELKTTRADVRGPQTAKVVGEGEIDCDEYGRILVQFHWDIEAAYSMRCRVSQNWAGAGWGGMVIPRIGMEVLVDFLDGDPDQPLVTGCVYNGANGVPYELPAHKTKSVFRSDTHQGSGMNEISFEDAKGAEVMFSHAQKDQMARVLNNRAARVDHSSVDSVGVNKLVSTGRNHVESIGGSMNLTVGGGLGGVFGALGAVAAAGGQDALAGAEAVGNKAISGFAAALAVSGAAIEASTGSARAGFDAAGNHRTVAGLEQAAQTQKIAGLLSSVIPLSGVLSTVVEKFRTDTVGLARTEQIGAYKNTSVGHTMTVNVGQEFLINCGKSKFIMDAEGNVTIIGTKFNFTASGNVQINGKVIDLN
ncbi:Rhs element Vgr protein, partial [Rhodobacter sp. JA431]|uniref:type VI secretion system Vgr family protein n=1 Tax=Rhodobacter sp. JA431 TaxID=570013 RepID=UPI000BCE4102